MSACRLRRHGGPCLVASETAVPPRAPELLTIASPCHVVGSQAPQRAWRGAHQSATSRVADRPCRLLGGRPPHGRLQPLGHPSSEPPVTRCWGCLSEGHCAARLVAMVAHTASRDPASRTQEFHVMPGWLRRGSHVLAIQGHDFIAIRREQRQRCIDDVPRPVAASSSPADRPRRSSKGQTSTSANAVASRACQDPFLRPLLPGRARDSTGPVSSG